MTPPATSGFSSLAMYPLPSLRAAWERFYRAVAADVSGAPVELRWHVEPHETWLSPQLALGMSCGWPLVTSLRGRVRVVGAFQHELDGAPAHTYRSVIVARDGNGVDSVDRADLGCRHAAMNSADSLSGCISLLAMLPPEPPVRAWPGELTWTGAHVASIDAVRDGTAEVASIDALTWAFVRRDDPRRLDGVRPIGRGPVVPTLPLIVAADASDEQLAAWRTALAAAVRSPDTDADRDMLLIRGFVALDAADYETALADLIPRFH